MPETETTVGGLRAVGMSFRPLRDIGTGRSLSYISRTHLNSPDMGILMPETFRPVAEAFGKTQQLFPLELLQLAESIRDMREAERVFNWISMEMPLSILRDRASVSLLDKVCEQFSLTPNSFCFAIPEAVLAESNSTAAENTERLRRRGYHLMLTSFGESGCPYIKLSELSVDYVMLSPSLTQCLGKKERTDQAVHSIITFINDQQAEPVADGVKNRAQAEALYEFGCNHCAGPLSGEYVLLDELLE